MLLAGRYFIPESEFEWEFVQSAGPGGQNVNKVETGVRVIYLPTGQASVCTEERSQYLNKQKALARLWQMVQSENQQKEAVIRNENWERHTSLERGNARAKFEGRYFKRVA